MSTAVAGVRRAGPALALAAILIGLWEAWVRVANVGANLLPPPSEVFEAAVRTRGALWGHTLTTVTETVLGMAIGAALGLALAAFLAAVPVARRAIEPLLVVMQTVPLFVMAPLLVLWFGFGMKAKVVVVVLIVFFPVAVATTGALTDLDPDQVDLVRSLGGSRFRVLTTVGLPAAVPAFFYGLRISAAYSAAGATIAELLGAKSGLGLYIARSQRSFKVDQVIAGVAIVAALSLSVFAVVVVASRVATPWRHLDSLHQNPGEPT